MSTMLCEKKTRHLVDSNDIIIFLARVLKFSYTLFFIMHCIQALHL